MEDVVGSVFDLMGHTSDPLQEEEVISDRVDVIFEVSSLKIELPSNTFLIVLVIIVSENSWIFESFSKWKYFLRIGCTSEITLPL